MPGFDPSKFLSDQPLDGGGEQAHVDGASGVSSPGQGAGSSPLTAEPAGRSLRQGDRQSAGSSFEPIGKFSDLSPPVADVAGARLSSGDVPIDPETGEILGGWPGHAETVAGVAGVAATPRLAAGVPFASEIEAMLAYPEPEWMKRGSWARVCDALVAFAEGKAAEALAAGWEPIELFGVYRHPWKRVLASDGLLWTAHGRTIGKIEPHAIEILNKLGPHNRVYRAHLMTNRRQCLLMWDAFHPSNRYPHGSG